MNWAWANSLDQLWRSATFPMWLTLAAAGFFALVLLVTLLRAERSVANGALTVITLLAIGVAGAATIRGPGGGEEGAPPQTAAFSPMNATLPALSCIDDLAGEAVLTACEKVLFGSPESAAAAVSYAASRITRLTAWGDVATANRNMTPDLQALRHAVERDRYGLVAHVLLTRDHCTPVECAAFRSLTDHDRIVAHMDERVYDGLISRYAPSWNMPVAPAPATVAALPPSMPTGRPTNADFPSAASTPPVSIMTPEPAPRPAPAATSPPPPPRPTVPALSAAKKPPRHPAAPVQLAPAPPVALTPAPAPAASNN
ncbi:MAG: hypothetical protein ABI407_07640 [Bradyrhizobium sp.]